MGEGDEGEMDGRRWSEFLSPPAGSTPGGKLPDDGQQGQDDGEDEGEREEESGSLCSLQSHVTFASLPSYMRSKSGLEMDPDRVRFCWVFGVLPLVHWKHTTAVDSLDLYCRLDFQAMQHARYSPISLSEASRS